MDRVLRGLIDRGVVVYIDDILIYSDNEEEHIALVREVLKRLHKHGLAVELEKCYFHVNEIDFLGYIFGREGIKMDAGKVKEIIE